MRLSCLLSLLLIFSVPASAQDSAAPIIDLDTIHQPVIADGGMVVSQEALASHVGADILLRGGNAVDAAVATGFALAVTLPRAGNLGGGGFMLVYLAAEGRTVAIDYREMAPAAATRDMFLDESGAPDPQKSRFSHLAAGVPGSVAGLLHTLERYGTLEAEEVIRPAIRLAEDGVIVSYDLASSLKRAQKRFSASPAAQAVFMDERGEPLAAGDLLVQSDLAWSLEQIAARGRAGFYEGPLADRLVADMEANGGLVTHADLENYEVVERAPVTGRYRGYEVVTMPPPSSGGVHVVQMLNVVESDDLAAMGWGSADAIHLLAEAMKPAYADRAKYLGDPDFFDVPVAALTDKAYGRRLRAEIDMARARPADMIAAAEALPYESNETTHYSVVDGAGNVVAVTTTLNFSYGSGRMAAGTGILLNNEMDDFSAKPGVPNAFGLLGAEANAIAPGKRPLSSMTPLILMRDGEPYMVTGSPGGSTIITIVMQMIVNVVDHGLNIAEATGRPRVHHQWRPDRLFYEPGHSPDTLRLLEAKGHKLFNRGAMGATQSILIDGGLYYGAADSRRPTAAAVGIGRGVLDRAESE